MSRLSVSCEISRWGRLEDAEELKTDLLGGSKDRVALKKLKSSRQTCQGEAKGFSGGIWTGLRTGVYSSTGSIKLSRPNTSTSHITHSALHIKPHQLLTKYQVSLPSTVCPRLLLSARSVSAPITSCCKGDGRRHNGSTSN